MNNDKEFLNNIKYFWNEKQNIARYVDFDRNRLRKINPLILQAWDNYLIHKHMLDSLCN